MFFHLALSLLRRMFLSLILFVILYFPQITLALVPNDPDFGKQWYLENPQFNHINIEKAWDLTTGSSEVIVAIVDSGVDYKNPELKENLWTNKMEATGRPGVDDDENGYIDDIHGYDFVNEDGDPMDDHAHGTHLASIIGSKGNNGIGMAGIAWNIRLLPVKVLDSSNSQNNLEIVERGIRYAVDNGAQIINASFAFTFNDDEMDRKVQSAIKYAEERNVLVIAGSGNDGDDIDYVKMLPASFENSNILTVTASNEGGWRIDFANMGLKSVDLAAPGRNIWGLLPKLGSRFWGGTSQATAITSGVAALVLSKYPKLKPSEVRRRLMNSVKKSGKFKGESITDGLLDAYQALL